MLGKNAANKSIPFAIVIMNCETK